VRSARGVAAERLTDLSRMVGAKEQSARGFVVWLEELRRDIGIPHDLRAAGVREEHLDRLVQIAVADACHPNNPRPVSESDFRALFRQALGAS